MTNANMGRLVLMYHNVLKDKPPAEVGVITEEDVVDLFTNILHWHISTPELVSDVLRAFQQARHHFEAEYNNQKGSET